MSARPGVTLVELLVVIAILAITTTLTSVALRRVDAAQPTDAGDQVLALRRDVITAGRPMTRFVRRDSATYLVTVLADGRVLADSALGLDPSTGLHHATKR